MTDWQRQAKRKQEVRSRAESSNHMYSYCRVVGCGKTARAGTKDGLDTRFCRSHAEQYQRHGSPYTKSYPAKVVSPYRMAAINWIKAHEDDIWTKNAIQKVEGLYQNAGPHVEAFRLRGLEPQERAKAAWARLRKAEVDPRIPLAAWIAIEMVLDNDPQADQHHEFKQVQVAKIVHRLASGTHKKWRHEIPAERNPHANKPIITVEEMHVYPRSRGRVLRHLGDALEKAAELLVEHHLADIQAFKRQEDERGVVASRPNPKGVGVRRRTQT